MSHPNPSHDPENVLPEDAPITLSQAIDIMYDPYESVVRENFDWIREMRNEVYEL